MLFVSYEGNELVSIQVKNVSGWSESGSIINFRSKTLYKFLADESPKLDSDVVVLPNLVTTSKNLFFFITANLPILLKCLFLPNLLILHKYFVEGVCNFTY